jgi:hypothetical protein
MHIVTTNKQIIYAGGDGECEDILAAIKLLKHAHFTNFTGIALVDKYGEFEHWLDNLTLEDEA